jgi:glycerol-1-phosphatase
VTFLRPHTDEDLSISSKLLTQLAQTGNVRASPPTFHSLTNDSEDVREVEGRIPREFGHDAVEILGARSLLMALEEVSARWTIVTSGTQPLAQGWLKILGLIEPPFIVTAEDVVHGKPDPACYNLGRKKLGLPEFAPVLVFEDAPAGIRAGKAAGCLVVALTTTHAVSHLIDAGADWIVQDLRSVKLDSIDLKTGEMNIRISGTCMLR